MATELYNIITWVKTTGPAMSYSRFKLKLLPVALGEGLKLDDVSDSTVCSPEFLSLARDAATGIVGNPCPH